MSIASISIHGVAAIHTGTHALKTGTGTCQVRKLCITTRDGERLEFVLYADDPAALRIKTVADATNAAFEVSLAIQEARELELKTQLAAACTGPCGSCAAPFQEAGR
jgi:hypothetical protein